MKRLILMRHAEAGWHINMEDHERPLSANGIRDAKKIGSWLKEKEYIPDEVISSTCLLYTSPSPRDVEESRMPSSA